MRPPSVGGLVISRRAFGDGPKVATSTSNVALILQEHRPGGNFTGTSNLGVELSGKQLGLLHDLIPGAKRFAMLIQ